MYALSFQKAYMSKIASNTTVPYLNKSACNSIPVPKPPAQLQEQFATLYSAVYSNSAKFHLGSKQIVDLCQSLTQRAFTGELSDTKAR